MAYVYEASDAAREGGPVALKRLLQQPDRSRQQRNVELFEREFHGLAQLTHPHIVDVYEFGVDELGPFYTMQLLDGGDMQEAAPLAWGEACAIGRQLCSALSLLHSRRLVHRDLSPRNVRRTAGGEVKLIDFGALAPFGASKLVVGTPPYCPPESVQLRQLDGRTDLFALGATLYYVVTGRHAFPAYHFHDLPAAWRAGFARASELVPGIPPALDVLLSELLQLDADARPASAGEVLQRLAAIGGTPVAESVLVARAYLSTPSLVGREDALLRARRRLGRVAERRARNLSIEGEEGAGRSRFLDACLLEASLLGLLVLRADAADAETGEYGVVRSLMRQLFAVEPLLAREAAEPVRNALATLVPELGPTDAAEPDELTLQAAVRTWLHAVSRARPLVIGLDDLDRCDARSAAVLTLAAVEQTERTLCIVFSVASGPAPAISARRLLEEEASRIELANLSPADTRKLLASLFGDVPNLDLLAQRAFALCQGNPRALLQLSQHLIDRGIVRYEAGVWTLPDHLDAAELPSSISAALQARIAALGASARELAGALALCGDTTFGVEECAVLSGAADPASLRRDIDTLVRAEIVRELDARVGLTHPTWARLLSDELPPEQRRTLDLRLARVLERRGDHEFLRGRHLLRAGETERALDVLVRYAEDALANALPLGAVAASMMYVPARDWWETYDLALRACDELGRPVRDKLTLLLRATALGGILGRPDHAHVKTLLEMLSRHSGLSDYYALPADLAPHSRLMAALTAAQKRHSAASEHERGMDPTAAIRALVRTMSTVTGHAATAFDLAYIRDAPEVAPFESLAPVIVTVNRLRRGVELRLTGSVDRAAAEYRDLIAVLESPDRGGLDPIAAGYTRAGVLNALGLIEAGGGHPSCVQRIEALAAYPVFEVNALLLRMLYEQQQGDAAGAEQSRRQAERARLQYGARPMYGSGHLVWELQAHAITEDLTRMRQVIDEAAPLAKVFAGWVPTVHFAAAEYHRIRRSPAKALAELQMALRLAPPGGHQLWPCMASCQVLVLIDLGRIPEAHAAAQRSLTAAEDAQCEVPPLLFAVASLAEAHAARSGLADADVARARARADGAIEVLLAAGVSGIRIGFAHELRARIALLEGDGSAFGAHAERCEAIYCAHTNPALLAKHRRLAQLGPRASASADADERSVSAKLAAALDSCGTPELRAQLALTFLLQHGGASGGMLFTLGAEGVEQAARLGELPDLRSEVQGYLEAQLQEAAITRTDSTDDSPQEVLEWSSPSGQRLRPVLLAHTHAGVRTISGVLVYQVPAVRGFAVPVQIVDTVSRVLARTESSSLVMLVD